jgi:hypothetical protein
VLRFLAVFALAMGTLLVSSQSVADSRSRAESNENRWIPSLAITLGVTIHDQDGSVGSNGFRFVGLANPPASIEDDPFRETLARPEAADTKTLKSIHVGGMLEIESPSIPLPYLQLRPRIFFGGEFEQVSSKQQNLAIEGVPEQSITDFEGVLPFSAISLLGRGTAIRADLDNIQFGAWIGVSIPVQLGDWKISIKPAARYLNQKVHFAGIFSHGIRNNLTDIGSQARNIPTNVYLVQFQDSLDVHALGPGLEIEIEVGAIRSLSASVFISGGVYRVLSDRKVDVEMTANPSRTGLPFYFFETKFTAELDPWIYRANVGLRFKWKGSPEGWLFGLGG